MAVRWAKERGARALYCFISLLLVAAFIWGVSVLYDNTEAKVQAGGELQMKQLTAGKYHTCAIASDNQAYCWGEGSNGRLGNGSTDDRNTPVAVLRGEIPAGSTIYQISAGEHHTCVLASDDKVYCWGSGEEGQLGNGSTDQQDAPVAVLLGDMPVGTTVKQISSTDWNTCAIASDNKAYCWGWGDYGQLGNGTTTPVQSTPVAVSQGDMPAGATILQINGADWHVCAIASDNKAYCWGAGSGGRLGDGTATQQNTPSAVSQGDMPSGATIRYISGGDQHTCAIASDNKAYCWGAGTNGSLGNGSTSQQNTPVAVSQGDMPSGATVIQIISGNYHTCAIASDNKAYCWGGGDDGQLGNNDTSHHSSPVAVSQGDMPVGSTIQQIDGADWHTCAIASDNQAYCWGYGGPGQLGNGTNPTVQDTPVAVSSISRPVAVAQSAYRVYSPSATASPGSPFAVTNTPAALDGIASDFRLRIGLTNLEGIQFLEVSSGGTHTCAIASDSKAYCWGAGANGHLGNGSTDNQFTPVVVSQGDVPAGVSMSQVVAGLDHTCAIASDGKAYCWGTGTSAQLGNGQWDTETTPVAVSQGAMPSNATIRQVGVGNFHSCAIASDSQAYCWGNGDIGRLGNGNTSNHDTPVAVSQGAMPSGATVHQISVGPNHSCAIASDSQAYCWGNGANGRLGNGDTANQTTPVAVSQGAMPSGATILQVGTGSFHSCALASDNKVYCWGNGAGGRLGNGSTGEQTTPVAVSQGVIPFGATIKQISVGFDHSCAIASDNKAYCWGIGGGGRLGDSGTSNRTTPVAALQGEMTTGATIYRITAGETHTCAIASDGKAYCWGAGSSGQLGNGNTSQYTTPVVVYQGEVTTSGSAALTINTTTGGVSHTCAIGSDSKAYCWGEGDEGRLGNGSTGDQTSPAAVSQGAMPAGATIRQIAAGYHHTCAIASDNKAYCWGLGNNGRLGNGSTGQQNTPVAVSQGALPAGATFRQIVAGDGHTCAIASDNKAYCWGYGGNGQLGNGDTPAVQNTPVAVSQGAMPVGATIKEIVVGMTHTCAIASDNKAYCWGWGGVGQLGNGTTAVAQSTPSAVSQGAIPVGVTIEQISASYGHTCAIASDNKAYCWGEGQYGRLGSGTEPATQTTPIAVMQGAMPAGATMKQISANFYNTCAIASDNKAYCWGGGNAGRLGNGISGGSYLTPVAVLQGAMPAGATVRQISTSIDHTCALASDNRAYCWGYGGSGQLGNGATPGTQTTAVAVSEGAMADSMITIGTSHLNLNLQVAPLGIQATCSAVSTGWENISATSAMNWGTSPPTHTTSIATFGSDPAAPTGGGYVYQSIVQSGSFTNNQSIAPRQTGLWDVVLHDRSGQSATDYCFRVVSNTAGTSIDQYSQYPRVTTALGSLGLQFVDDSGTPLAGGDAGTPFTPLIVSGEVQESLGELLLDSDKLLEVHNSVTNSGWSVSLAATDGPSAAWQSDGSSYAYNAADSSNGQLTVDMADLNKVAVGNDPTGAACTSVNLTDGTSGTFNNVVSSITILSGSPSAQFNCTWRLGSIGLSQTVPASQAGGSYTLDLTATVVAN